MSKLTDLLEQHTAQAVYRTLLELAMEVEGVAARSAENGRAKQSPEYAQGMKCVVDVMWEFIEPLDPH